MLSSARSEHRRDLIEVRCDGDIPGGDMDALHDLIATVVVEQDKARLLVEYVDIGSVAPMALLEDARMAGEFAGLAKVAVVAERAWVRRLASAENAVGLVEIETFEPDRRDAALAWLGS